MGENTYRSARPSLLPSRPMWRFISDVVLSPVIGFLVHSVALTTMPSDLVRWPTTAGLVDTHIDAATGRWVLPEGLVSTCTPSLIASQGYSRSSFLGFASSSLVL